MKKKEDSGGLPPVAIIGIGCMFPQAGDAEEFWSNIKGGVDAKGQLIALRDHFVTFSQDGAVAASAEMGPAEYPARMVDHLEFVTSMIRLRAPTGPMRAPRSNGFGFAFTPGAAFAAAAGGGPAAP